MVDAWPVDWNTDFDKSEFTEQQIKLAELFAAQSLRHLTLGRVGGKSITVLPCASGCRNRHFFDEPAFTRRLPFHPYLTESGMYANCWCASGCNCDDSSYFTLKPPVGLINEIRINGVLLPAEKYRVENDTKVVRLDGLGWPSCAGDNFTVTYLNGYPVDTVGRYVAGILAQEFLKRLKNDKTCRLPRNITSVNRQGISMEFKVDGFGDGVTGIPEVDSYTLQWNPHRAVVLPQVYSPDLPKQRQITWP